MSVEKQVERIEELLKNTNGNVQEAEAIKKGLIDHITLMEEILQSIPEVIGVMRPNYTFAFFNNHGYDFFGKTREEVKELSCYQVLGSEEKCNTCAMDKVLETKQETFIETFADELGRYMEFFYKPVLDENDEVDLIIVKMRDVTKQKIFEKQLQMQEKSYRKLYENAPYGIAIIKAGKTLMVNTEIIKTLGYQEEELKTLPFIDLVHKDYKSRAHKHLQALKNHNIEKVETELILLRKDGKAICVELMGSMIDFLGVKAKQIIIKDISLIKKEMEKASKIQKVRMQKYPADLDKINFEMIYHPKFSVSGDFFHIFKISETEILGFLGDSNGNGVTAALLNSAVKVIINDVITKTTEPADFLNMIDQEFQPLFEEDYVAAICFKIDFEKNKVTITSAGINEYVIERKGSPTLSLLKGPPVGGKIKETTFDTNVHDFNPGDRLYVFTDGFGDDAQKLLFEEKIYKDSLPGQKVKIKNYFSNPDNIKDDTLWVGIEYKKQ